MHLDRIAKAEVGISRGIPGLCTEGTLARQLKLKWVHTGMSQGSVQGQHRWEYPGVLCIGGTLVGWLEPKKASVKMSWSTLHLGCSNKPSKTKMVRA